MEVIDSHTHWGPSITLGSDIPFGTMKWELEKVLSLSIGDDEKEMILSKNIKRLTYLE